ncbi:MAG: AAA family ATPase [Desulfobulbus sp.]|jgi:type II secretory pathway predicted ATPase ExeA|uniref:ExeA family protein n=1 Tax=Desulfobulbus sp. TaxID=895 RepID=UPI002845B2A1|nr:AAA family ATPase [Desulfobulbus sp.]MDR2549846.1 AAA family ATPase [Desulfobulbus sp.]
MYLEHFHLTHPPFTEDPDPDVFFSGARREEICQSLILDVLAGKRLVKLTGREGSGKTLLWRMMAERLPSEYEVIFLDNPIGTFDELLRLLCLDLGMDPRGTELDTDYIEVLYRLLARKKAEQGKVVLIVDQAEKLHLATLERLLALVADDQEELEWTTILVGRPGLDEHLEQISVFRSTIDVHAGYVLDELTESETRHYLRFCLNAAGMRRAQFEDVFTDAVIADIFDAARGNVRLTNACAEEVLQDSCADRSFMVLLDGVEPEEQEEEAPPFRWEQRVLELYEVLRYNKFVSGALVGAVAAVLIVGFLLTGESKDTTPPAEPPAAAVPGETTASAPPTSPTGGTDAIAEAPPPAATPSSRAAAPDEERDGDKLLRERLAASASWLTGMQQGKYTIQLMMLASNQAKASMAATLAEDDFFRVREQLFIFRKKSTPPTILVFYGLYDSLDAAREARNNMPVLLRKHHPYPLAVDDAMKKLSN